VKLMSGDVTVKHARRCVGELNIDGR
jgi:hypothetical protein